MDIKTLKLSDIKPYEKNPRKNDNAVDKVAASIKEFGFRQPIVVDRDNVIVAGHTRYKAAKKLGMKEVLCVMANDLTEEQIKAYRLADNKTAEFAEWDFDLLNTELDGIFDIDMSAFGFLDETENYGDNFTLPDGEKEPFCQMTFTLAEEQAELIKYAISQVSEDIHETFGNENSNGNGLHEVVRQWAELKK